MSFKFTLSSIESNTSIKLNETLNPETTALHFLTETARKNTSALENVSSLLLTCLHFQDCGPSKTIRNTSATKHCSPLSRKSHDRLIMALHKIQ